MKIKKLQIKNFKNISDIEIDNFDKINLVQGNTGQGKTTILEAINLLLLNSLNSKTENYIKWGESKFSIYGEFDLKDNYKYTINGDKKGFSRKLIINDTDEYVNSDAVKKISEVINPKLAKYSCFSEQGEATRILFEKGTERLENFKVLFGIEKIFNVVENIKLDISNNKDTILTIEGELNSLKSRNFEFEDIPELPNINIEEYKEKLEQLDKDREEFQKQSLEYQKYEEQLKQYNNSKEEIEICNNVLLEIEGNIYKEKDNIKQLPDYDEKRLHEIQNNISILQKDKLQLENERGKKEENEKSIKNIKNKIILLEKELEELVIERLPRLKMNEAELEKLYNEIGDLKIYRNSLEGKIKAIDKGKCPTCHTDFTGIDSSDYRKELTDLDSNILQKEEEYEEIRLSIKKYNTIKNENNITQSKIDNIQKQCHDLNNELTILYNKNFDFNEDKYNEVIQKISDLTNEYNTINKLKIEYDEIKTLNESVEKNIQKLQEKEKDIQSKISVYRKIQKPDEYLITITFDVQEYKNIQDQIMQYNIVLNDIEGIKERNNKLRKEKRQNAVKIEELEIQIDELRKNNRLLEDSKKIVDKDFSAWVISKGSEFIKKKMNLFFQKAYSKYYITFQQSKKSLDFFYGYKDMIQAPVEMASGYEKEVLSIAFRIALSSLQNLGLMSLDEIDSFASDEKSVQLFQTLFNESNIEQFFIITHNEMSKEMIKNDFDANVYELKEGKMI